MVQHFLRIIYRGHIIPSFCQANGEKSRTSSHIGYFYLFILWNFFQYDFHPALFIAVIQFMTDNIRIALCPACPIFFYFF